MIYREVQKLWGARCELYKQQTNKYFHQRWFHYRCCSRQNTLKIIFISSGINE